MFVCLEQGADLHMAQLMPLPPTVYCFSKIQIGFTFLVPAHLGSPGQRAIEQLHAQPMNYVGYRSDQYRSVLRQCITLVCEPQLHHT